MNENVLPTQTCETETRHCSRIRCMNLRDKDNQRYCRSCHAAYMRTWRQSRIINTDHVPTKMEALLIRMRNAPNG